MKHLRLYLLVFAGALAGISSSAQLGEEIVARHARRAGDHLAELTALRSEGRTFIQGEVVAFTITAQRPGRLRVESFTPLRRVIQATDGTGVPWISHSEVNGGLPQDMDAGEARDFSANADFDGPLVDHAAKGFSVDYAGEEAVDGHAAYKLLLMDRGDSIFFLWVEKDTGEIVKRTLYRVKDGQRVAVDTFFRDFRRVGGVLQPHRIETLINGRILYVMIIDRMEANPAPLALALFARPARETP